MRSFIYFFIAFLFIGCKSPKEGERQIIGENNTNASVIFLRSPSYPDTVNFTLIGSLQDIANIVKPFDSKPYSYGYGAYKNWAEELTTYNENTMMVFVYDADAVAGIDESSNAGRDSLYKRPDLILKRFDVTISYLEANHYKLVYP